MRIVPFSIAVSDSYDKQRVVLLLLMNWSFLQSIPAQGIDADAFKRTENVSV